MNNLNNILDYLKVFNNIDKKSEPRFMAQGGRLGHQSGQLVQPGPGRQGYAGVKGMKSKKTTSRAYNMTPAEDTFAKQEWKASVFLALLIILRVTSNLVANSSLVI